MSVGEKRDELRNLPLVVRKKGASELRVACCVVTCREGISFDYDKCSICFRLHEMFRHVLVLVMSVGAVLPFSAAK